MALDMDKMKEPLDDLCKRTSIVKSINILDRLRGETYVLLKEHSHGRELQMVFRFKLAETKRKMQYRVMN